MSSVKIPKKMWVVKTAEHRSRDPKLAYMCPLGENGTKNMQKTGRSWAGCRHYDYEEKKYKEYQPGSEIEFDNTPKSGFKILKAVSRWSTSNKVWRVEDPRGFIVEIYTGNMEEIVQHSTIDHGVIKTECVWGRTAGKNVLLPVDTPEYLEAKETTEALDNKVDLKTLKPGSRIRLINEKSDTIYLGRGYTVRMKGEALNFDFFTTNSKSYLFMDIDSDRIQSKSKLNVLKVVDENFFDIGDNPIKFINEKISCGEWRMYGSYAADGNEIFVVDKKSDLNDAQVRFGMNSYESMRDKLQTKDKYNRNFMFLAQPVGKPYAYTIKESYYNSTGKGEGQDCLKPHTCKFQPPHHYTYRNSYDRITECVSIKRIDVNFSGGVNTFPLKDLKVSPVHATAQQDDHNRGTWYANKVYYFTPEEKDWILWIPCICIKDFEVRLFA